MSIVGEHEPTVIAIRFMDHCKVYSSLVHTVQMVDTGEMPQDNCKISAKDVATVIKIEKSQIFNSFLFNVFQL